MATFDPLSFKMPNQHIVDGVLLNGMCSERFLRKVQQIKYAASDVMVASYPKTGTSLLQEMVDLIRHSGEVNENPNIFRIPYLELNPADDPDQLNKSFHPVPPPRTVKTHFPFDIVKDAILVQKVRCIYIVRIPKDVMVSFYHFYRMNELLGSFPGTWDQFFEMVMVDHLFYGNVFDHYLSWWRYRQEPNLLIVRYEDLLRQPEKEISKMAKFCDVELTDVVIGKIVLATSFDTMKKNPSTNYACVPTMRQEISPFMRKGVSGDWKNYFSAGQGERFDKMMKDRLSAEPELMKYVLED